MTLTPITADLALPLDEIVWVHRFKITHDALTDGRRVEIKTTRGDHFRVPEDAILPHAFGLLKLAAP